MRASGTDEQSSLGWLADVGKMVCSKNDTALDFKIPVVIVSRSNGLKIFEAMDGAKKGEHT